MDNPSTLLVAIDHVMFRSSAVVDIAPIVEKANKVGAFVILDTFHSVGTQQLQLEQAGVHAAVGGALKWLCGGPGNCFLYVRPDLIPSLTPAFTGWAAHKQPFLFSPEGQDYRDDGHRFATGTPNVPALYAGMEGIATCLEAGLDNIRRRSVELTTLLVEEAQRHGFRPMSAGGVDIHHIAWPGVRALSARMLAAAAEALGVPPSQSAIDAILSDAFEFAIDGEGFGRGNLRSARIAQSVVA